MDHLTAKNIRNAIYSAAKSHQQAFKYAVQASRLMQYDRQQLAMNLGGWHKLGDHHTVPEKAEELLAKALGLLGNEYCYIGLPPARKKAISDKLCHIRIGWFDKKFRDLATGASRTLYGE